VGWGGASDLRGLCLIHSLGNGAAGHHGNAAVQTAQFSVHQALALAVHRALSEEKLYLRTRQSFTPLPTAPPDSSVVGRAERTHY
jgi:hypothetical protein